MSETTKNMATIAVYSDFLIVLLNSDILQRIWSRSSNINWYASLSHAIVFFRYRFVLFEGIRLLTARQTLDFHARYWLSFWFSWFSDSILQKELTGNNKEKWNVQSRHSPTCTILCILTAFYTQHNMCMSVIWETMNIFIKFNVSTVFFWFVCHSFGSIFRNGIRSRTCHNVEVLLYLWTDLSLGWCLYWAILLMVYKISERIYPLFLHIHLLILLLLCVFFLVFFIYRSIKAFIFLFRDMKFITMCKYFKRKADISGLYLFGKTLARTKLKDKKMACRLWLICHVTNKNETFSNVQVGRQSEVIIISGEEWKKNRGKYGKNRNFGNNYFRMKEIWWIFLYWLRSCNVEKVWCDLIRWFLVHLLMN